MRRLSDRVRHSAGDARKYAPALSYLLTPVAMTGYALAFWRLGADLDWTSEFFISDGVLSKWQVWLALAVATQIGAHHLNNRSGRSGDAAGA